MAAQMTALSARVSAFVAAPKTTARGAKAPAARATRVVKVRAEDKLATTDRSKTGLYFASEQSLSYLDGTLPGDYGFDPLGISDPDGPGGFITPNWLAYAEVIHARFAMLGAAGCFAPEFLAKAGVVPADSVTVWYASGVMPPAGTYTYWADPFALFFGQMVLMGFAEFRRLQDYRKPGSMGEQYFIGLENVLGGSGDPAYPGGQFFNMFNLGKDDMDKMKLREIKNGRAAMLAMLGFAAQASMTGVGPYQNLMDHLSNPTGANLLTNLGTVGGSF